MAIDTTARWASMAESSIDPDALVAEARNIVKALSIAQVGGHHSMAELEAMDFFDRLEEPNLLYAVLKVFSATVAALAEYTATETIGIEDGAEHEQFAAEFIRRGVDALELDISPRTDEPPPA